MRDSLDPQVHHQALEDGTDDREDWRLGHGDPYEQHLVAQGRALVSRRVVYPTTTCPRCHGQGTHPEEAGPCVRCRGRGRVGICACGATEFVVRGECITCWGARQ